MIYTLLTDPFSVSNPATLIQGIRVLQSVIITCWPLLSEQRHRVELLRALSVCWFNLNETPKMGDLREATQSQEARNELKIAAALLLKAFDDAHAMQEVGELVHYQPELSALFSDSSA